MNHADNKLPLLSRRFSTLWLCGSAVGALSLVSWSFAQAPSQEKHYDEQGRLIRPYGSTPSEKAWIKKAEGFAIANRKMRGLESKAWISEEWTGNNGPYRAITREVHGLLRQKRLASTLLSYQRAAQAAPLDAQTQYRSVLAGFNLEMQDWPVDRNKLLRWREDLAGPDAPQTLDYARLRFLVEAAYYEDQKLRPLGARLLQAAPGDNWVSFFMERLQRVSTDPRDIRTNLAEAYKKLKANPNDRKAVSAIARARMSLWSQSKRRSDAQALIATYRRYQELLPVGSPNIARVEQRIRDINTSQQSFDRRGVPNASR